MQPINSSFLSPVQPQSTHDSSLESKAWDEVVKVLQAKGLPNNFNMSLCSPLYAAVLLADLELCKKIVGMGYPINSPGIPCSQTPLYQAVYPGREEIALYLIEKGADVRITDEVGSSYLHFAVHHSLPHVVDALIQGGVFINAAATVPSHPDLSCSKYTGAPEEAYVTATPLYLALREDGKSNSQQIAVALIKNGADISYRGPNGINLLDLATYKAYDEVCKLLVEKGLKVSTGFNFNASPSKIHPINAVLHDQILQYRKMLDSLIDEKPGITPERKAQKKEKICNLAKTFLTIEGDEAFKQKIQHYIEKIAELKPGRKLIKALAKNSKENTKIWSGVKTQFGCNRYTGDFNIQVDNIGVIENSGYKTINDKLEVRIFQFSDWIVFAHELVHALHFHLDMNEAISASNDKGDLLDDMTDLGEQHAITGFNHHLLPSKKNLHKTDVLCENAFSLAIGLPPRIDHLGYLNWDPSVDIDLSCFKEKNVREVYYEWLEKELNLIRSIPKDKEEDKEFILEYLKKYPLALESLPEKMKADKEFALQVVKMDWYRLELFPILWSDRDVMLEAIKRKDYNIKYVSKELFADKEVMDVILETIKKRSLDIFHVPIELFTDKEFVLNVLKIVKDSQKKELAIELIKFRLEQNPSLKNDPEINKYLVQNN
jgi:ankyrin repeat protein